MKKYLKKSFAVLTCTTMCIQTTMAILAEKIPGSDTSQQISIQALTTGQLKKDSTGLVVSKCRWKLSEKPVEDDQRTMVSP